MSIEQLREESTELAIQRMEWEGAPVPTTVDDLARKELSVRTVTNQVQEASVRNGELKAMNGGESPLSAPTKASLMGKQARGIFDGVIDQVTHRPPAARQKPR